jgi:hypothetical protein
LGAGLLAAAQVALAGCMGFLHPIKPDADTSGCQHIARCCCEHVYIFLMNGLDPVNYGNLTGLRDYLQNQGMTKTYYGQIYHVWSFEKEIRRIHRDDPDARFVLIGFSLGANLVDSMARSVQPDGVTIDLMVFLSGNHPVYPMPKDQPPNVARVVNVLASGLMASRGDRSWAENLRLSGTMHFDSPTDPRTLEALSRELAAVAQMVPVSEQLPPVRSREEAPPPRPVKARTSEKRGEWDFLKPVAHLSPWPDEPVAMPANAIPGR